MIKDKYIIFLHEKCFISSTNYFSCFKPTFNIVNELQNSGITVININDNQNNSQLLNPEDISIIDKFKEQFKENCSREPTLEELIDNLSDHIDENDIKKVEAQSKNSSICLIPANSVLSFDDYHAPKINVLYIKLIEGEYYSAELYSKTKLEKERQMLFLLAGKLGVHTINYKTEIVETVISNNTASISVNNVGLSTSYNKTTSKQNGVEGNEVYSNRGAPVYSISNQIGQIEKTIESKFKYLSRKSSNFSWEVYKNSPNLQSFVYKRFVFKMIELEYISKTDDIIDKSFEIKTILLNYGIGIKLDSYTSITDNITYKITFFNDDELNDKLTELARLTQDKFVTIRKFYDSEKCKNEKNIDIVVYHIATYVRNFAKKLLMPNGDNYSDRLEKWINNNKDGVFEGDCHNFISSSQISTWLKRTLKEDEDPIDNDDDDEFLKYSIPYFKNKFGKGIISECEIIR
jgi:hypothetical protein